VFLPPYVKRSREELVFLPPLGKEVKGGAGVPASIG